MAKKRPRGAAYEFREVVLSLHRTLVLLVASLHRERCPIKSQSQRDRSRLQRTRVWCPAVLGSRRSSSKYLLQIRLLVYAVPLRQLVFLEDRLAWSRIFVCRAASDLGTKFRCVVAAYCMFCMFSSEGQYGRCCWLLEACNASTSSEVDTNLQI